MRKVEKFALNMFKHPRNRQPQPQFANCKNLVDVKEVMTAIRYAYINVIMSKIKVDDTDI